MELDAIMWIALLVMSLGMLWQQQRVNDRDKKVHDLKRDVTRLENEVARLKK